MPRKPRIEIAGYYHIINRGVEQRIVFKDDEDFNYFLNLLCKFCADFDIVLHNYCFMNNHYHLLIELKKENLSKFMRQINSQYAIYFNKKYKRSGHLWQGRFKSWYVTDEAYLYTLMRYIEQNPIKANIIKDMKNYLYSSYHHFLDINNISGCLKDSWIVENFNNVKDIKSFFNEPIDYKDLQELKKASNLVIASDVDKKPDEEKLKKILKDFKNIKHRNKLILKAYKDGYSQHKIAKVLELNQATIQRIIKRTMKSSSISIT